MILVADLVAPAAEAAAGVDVFCLELGQQGLEHAFALEGRGRVAVIEAAVVGRNDLVGGLEHVGADEAADGVFDDGLVIDGFEGGLGNFEHDGPIGACFWVGRGRFGA